MGILDTIKNVANNVKENIQYENARLSHNQSAVADAAKSLFSGDLEGAKESLADMKISKYSTKALALELIGNEDMKDNIYEYDEEDLSNTVASKIKPLFSDEE